MPRDILILTEADLRGLLTLDPAIIDGVEQAFRALDAGGVVMPPILSMDLPDVHGEVDVKTAYIPGFEAFAIKVSPGFFNNPQLGLPSLNGLMIAFSATTGLVEAVFLDNGYLTDMRTAAAGAVAARALAPEAVSCAGVIGTGVQARLQMIAAHQVRPFDKALVWGRDPGKAKTCARDLSLALGIDVQVAADPAWLVARADLVITTTPSREPQITAEMIHPGLHITAMGSDQAGKGEIDPAVFSRLDRYVPDRTGQCRLLGELRAALDAGTAPDPADLHELGTVLRDLGLGRRSPADVTLADLTGTGAQDTAIASIALSHARAQGVGQVIQA